MTDTVIVADRGLFFHIAERLSRDVNVKYYLFEEAPSPYKQPDEIGVGYPNVKVIDNLWKNLDKNVPVIFPDVYNAGLPVHLHNEGFPVFSSLQSEMIETNRKLLKRILQKVGLPIPPTQYIKGLSATQEYLSDKKDKWLKSDYRGDFETYHYQNAFLSSQWFNQRKAEMGDGFETIEVIVEDNIPSDCEMGFEGPMLDGELAQYSMIGYEDKDKGYVGRVVTNLPPVMQDVHDKMRKVFKSAGYQGWYSTEMRRADDGTIYYEDATCRFGRPPSPCYCEIYKDFTKNVIDLSNGKLPVLRPSGVYAAEIIFTSTANENAWLPVQFPEEIKRWVKLYTPKKTAKGYYCIPHAKDGFLGSVVAIGNNLKETINTAMKRASMIKGDDITFSDTVIKHLLMSINEGRRHGVPF